MKGLKAFIQKLTKDLTALAVIQPYIAKLS